jgi:hypothetical protein
MEQADPLSVDGLSTMPFSSLCHYIIWGSVLLSLCVKERSYGHFLVFSSTVSVCYYIVKTSSVSMLASVQRTHLQHTVHKMSDH